MPDPLQQPGAPNGTQDGRAPFTRAEFARGARRPLSEGRWANAVLYLYERDGQTWVVKDFASRSLLVRNLIGRALVRREHRWLRRVDGITAAPRDAFRLDAHALAYRFVAGRSLRLTAGAELSPAFFPALEQSLRLMHARARIVHLDLRNAHNILVTDSGEPLLLDFQSCLGTGLLPPPLRRFAERIDLAAIYKHWARRSPATLGPERSAALARMNLLRPLWVLRGYIGARRTGPGRD